MSDSVLRERKRFLTGMASQLRLLEHDLNFERSGGTIRYVVDFAVIHSFTRKGFPAGRLKLDGESNERIYSRRQVALGFLFSGRVKNLLLIGPYNAELRNHLHAISVHASVADFDATYQIERIRVLIRSSTQFEAFMKARLASCSDDPAEFARLRTAAVDLGKEFFPELYTIVSCATTDELTVLRGLFDGGVLLNADDVITDLREYTYDSDRSSVDAWRKVIEKRRGPDRPFATFVDAIACAYLEAANKRHSPGELVVYVSQSYDVNVPLSRATLRSSTEGGPISIVRDVDFFWVACVHDHNLKRVRDSLRIVDDLLRVYDSATTQTDEVADLGRRIVIDLEPVWRQAENLMLLGDSHLLHDKRNFQVKIEDAFLEWLNVIASASVESMSGLEEQGRALFAQIRHQIGELAQQLPPTSSLNLINITKTTRGVRVSVPALADEMSPVIEIFDRPTIALAKRISQAHSERARLSLRDEIIRLASDSHASGGLRLLAAYVLAVDERYDEAFREIERGLHSAMGPERKELLYVASMLQRKLFLPLEAFENIQKALEADSTDPRFHLECGKIRWLRWYFDSHKSDKLSAVELDEAVRHLDLCVSALGGKPDDQLLIADAENALAFIQCERALTGSKEIGAIALEAAETHLTRLESLIPVSQWLARYHDTRGWINYARALSARAGRRHEECLKLLGEAEEMVLAAMTCEQKTAPPKDLLNDHLMAIRGTAAQLTQTLPAADFAFPGRDRVERFSRE